MRTILLLAFCAAELSGQSEDGLALAGVVRSAEEGPMEGVLVSARKTGSTITTTVVSDAAGRYRFPRNRLTPGSYTLRIRAGGGRLGGPQAE